MTSLERRQKMLKDVEQCVCVDRAAMYGDPEDNFARIAAIASQALPYAFSARDVAVFMACVKLARIRTSPDHPDHWVDLSGYAVCGGAIVSAEAEAAEKAHPEG